MQIAEVEEAARLGADAVVLFTALGGATEAGMIRTLAGIGRECAAMGMPLIAEAEFPTTYAAVEQLKERYGFEYLRLCACGSAPSWRPTSSRRTGRATAARPAGRGGAGIPLVLAGGSRLGDRELLQRMEAATAAGGIGCSVGGTSSCTAPRRRSPGPVAGDPGALGADKAFAELKTAPEEPA